MCKAVIFELTWPKFEPTTIDRCSTNCVTKNVQLHDTSDKKWFNSSSTVILLCQVGSSDIVASWAGGENGREVSSLSTQLATKFTPLPLQKVIDRFLPNVAILLSKCGVFYLLLLAQNKPSKLIFVYRVNHNMFAHNFAGEVCKMLSRDGLQSKLVISRTAGNEKIYVYKFFH